jgi:hypothetical protein
VQLRCLLVGELPLLVIEKLGSTPALMRHLTLVVVLPVIILQPAGNVAASSTSACRLGKRVADRVLLTPRPGTFYSVDALNPDVVRRGRTYYMFFSGNHIHTVGGNWRTGVATARSPLGPFRVRRWLRGDFLNGGTAVWRGRFWQAHSGRAGNELTVSRDGARWRRVARIPGLSPRGWPLSADYFAEALRNRLRIYMLVRRNPIGLGGSLASIDWHRGRWGHFRVLLSPSARPWETADLGEPAVVRIRGRRLLFYTATAEGNFTRSIGLARARGRGFARCARRPVIGPRGPRGANIAIDPSPLRVGRRLYVYYGAGPGRSIAADLGGMVVVRTYRP